MYALFHVFRFKYQELNGVDGPFFVLCLGIKALMLSIQLSSCMRVFHRCSVRTCKFRARQMIFWPLRATPSMVTCKSHFMTVLPARWRGLVLNICTPVSHSVLIEAILDAYVAKQKRDTLHRKSEAMAPSCINEHLG